MLLKKSKNLILLFENIDDDAKTITAIISNLSEADDVAKPHFEIEERQELLSDLEIFNRHSLDGDIQGELEILFDKFLEEKKKYKCQRVFIIVRPGLFRNNHKVFEEFCKKSVSFQKLGIYTIGYKRDLFSIDPNSNKYSIDFDYEIIRSNKDFSHFSGFIYLLFEKDEKVIAKLLKSFDSKP